MKIWYGVIALAITGLLAFMFNNSFLNTGAVEKYNMEQEEKVQKIVKTVEKENNVVDKKIVENKEKAAEITVTVVKEDIKTDNAVSAVVLDLDKRIEELTVKKVVEVKTSPKKIVTKTTTSMTNTVTEKHECPKADNVMDRAIATIIIDSIYDAFEGDEL